MRAVLRKVSNRRRLKIGANFAIARKLVFWVITKNAWLENPSPIGIPRDFLVKDPVGNGKNVIQGWGPIRSAASAGINLHVSINREEEHIVVEHYPVVAFVEMPGLQLPNDPFPGAMEC